MLRFPRTCYDFPRTSKFLVPRESSEKSWLHFSFPGVLRGAPIGGHGGCVRGKRFAASRTARRADWLALAGFGWLASRSGLALAYFRVDLASGFHLLGFWFDFGWLWLDFYWIWFDFGWIWIG